MKCRKCHVDYVPWTGDSELEQVASAFVCRPCYETSEVRKGPIKSDQYDDHMRELWPQICEVCASTFYVPKNQLPKRITCSRVCSGRRSQRREVVQCDFCGENVIKKICSRRNSRSGLRFCSRSCKDKAQRVEGIKELQLPHYGDGGGHYRERGLREANACNRCGYNRYTAMLDVHPKDGDRGNNVLSNLEVLCVWCHWLETRGIEPHSWDGSLPNRGCPEGRDSDSHSE